MSFSRPVAVDLFAGAGGMALGFEQAGFDIMASVEFDPVHCATHSFNFPYGTTICRSVVDVSGSEIRRLAGLGTKDIDVVFGGPPCQGFSTIGKRTFADERNSLVHHFLRLVVELKPKYFVMENVPGITLGNHEVYLRSLIYEFKKKGYRVEDNYRILKASEYGVPQSRRRLFLLGCRKEFDLPQYPKPSVKPAGSQADGELFDLPSGPSVWDAIGDLPNASRYSELFENDSIKAKFGKPSEYASYLRGVKTAKDDYSYRRQFDPEILTSSALTIHSKLSRDRFAATLHGDTEPVSRFYKLNPKGLCNTLRAGTASDRGAFTSPRPIHPFSPRCITVREAARLHSYPDWFRFHATKWHGFRQVGNSVPPLLAKAVASQIVGALKIKPIKPTKKIQLGNKELLYFHMTDAQEHYGLEHRVIDSRRRTNVQVGIA